jgi:hypothetical protein
MEQLKQNSLLALDQLMAWGVVSPEALFRSDIRIVGRPGRNLVLELVGLGLVFKEYAPRLSGPEGLAEREISFYRHLANARKGRLVAEIAPSLRAADIDAGRLALEALPQGATAHARILNDRLDAATVRTLASRISSLHRGDYIASTDFALASVPPLFCSFMDSSQTVRARTEAARDLLSAIQSTPSLFVDAGTSPNGTTSGSFIHGDLRLSNILTIGADQDLRILDWETCGLGDPLLDLAQAHASAAYCLHLKQASGLDQDRDLALFSKSFEEGYQTKNPTRSRGALWMLAGLAFLQFAFEDAQRGVQRSSTASLLRRAAQLQRFGER